MGPSRQVVTDPVATFASAAHSFAALVHDIPAGRWDRPGLGEWDLRALVGHASRSLITVSTYMQQPAEREDITTPQQYYAMVNPAALGIAPEGVVERGRQAGRDLGDDPAATVDGLVARVLDELSGVGDPLITVIGGAGIRLHTYLPTRTFELAVHGLDIARAVDISPVLPADVLEESTVLAARIAAAEGHGETVLLTLTGRGGLPPSFSIV
jgi:mycothiol maleylpyruvate isomerase-like protein